MPKRGRKCFTFWFKEDIRGKNNVLGWEVKQLLGYVTPG